MTLYHGTADKNKERILREGLRPAANAPDTKQRHANLYTELAGGSRYPASPKYVYLTNLPHKAVGYGYERAMGYVKNGRMFFRPVEPNSDMVLMFLIECEDLNPSLIRSGDLSPGETAYEGIIYPRVFVQFPMTDRLVKFSHDSFSFRLKDYLSTDIIEYLDGKIYDIVYP